MRTSLILSLFLSVTCLTASASLPPLKPGPALHLSEPGHFDFMEVDAKNERLLAAHKGAGTLALVDLKSHSVLPSSPVGHVQGVAIDPRDGVYVLGDDDEKKVVLLSIQSLSPVGQVVLPGPVDAVAVAPPLGKIYADEDDGSHVWVIDLKLRKLIATISIPGEPEVVAYDPKTNRIYQNIKTKDAIVVINPGNNTVEAQWPTLPATGPHGLVIDQSLARAYVAGHNGKLVALDLKSGKVLSQANIASGTDQIAFDEKTRTLYCASKGYISVVRALRSGLHHVADVPDHLGAHTIAVDTKRGKVWISYGDKSAADLQEFSSARP